jgi:crotonobetainyl-CoA:carnitine CoA-transferase CaiB-like acyl-CoA transferase
VEALLSGIRILDLTRLFPGAYASQQLARLGADVVRVESPHGVGGDWLRDLPVIFSALNRGKQSVAINLKHERGKAAFLRLLVDADVLFESFRPGVMEKLGLGFAEIRSVKSDLIYCSLSGYGADGPYVQRAGHDLNYAALSGVLSVTGTATGELAIPGIQVGDLAGASHAVTAMVSALFQRQRTGAGCHLEVSMFDGLVSWLTPQLAEATDSGKNDPPGLGWLTGGEPCYHLYRCADGWMSVAAIEPKFWNQLVHALGLTEFVNDAHVRGERAQDVIDALGRVFLRKTRDEWEVELGAIDVCCEPVLTFTEVANQPLAKARQLVEAADDIASPIRVDGRVEHAQGVAPTLGEHTDQLLLAAGYTEREIAALRAAQAIA